MTKLKIDGAIATNALSALEPLTPRLYANNRMRIVGVVELAHIERTEPGPDEDKEPIVKIGIKHIEIAREEQEEHLRKAMRALFLNRTAQGKLDEEGEIELSKRTLELTAGVLMSVEAARLKVALSHWASYAFAATRSELTLTQLREELKTVAEGLDAALLGGGGDDADG